MRDLFADFSACFRNADSVILGPLYSAGEVPIEGIDQHSLAAGVRRSGHPNVTAVDSPRDVIALIQRLTRPGDMVVCLGAGQSTEWAHALPDWLAEAHAPRLVGGGAA